MKNWMAEGMVGGSASRGDIGHREAVALPPFILVALRDTDIRQ